MPDWIDAAGNLVMSGVIGAMGAAGMIGEAPTHFPLDAMLAGFADGCQVSPALDALWTSAVRGEALVLPETGRHYFGGPQVRMDTDFREIRVPVQGEWMGHAVEHFAFFAGNENGISLVSVQFHPSAAGVAETLAPLAETSSARLAADPENFTDIATAFVSEDGLSQYYCDFST